ncbi:apolipoprotein N-acyltransferase [Jannaschia seosinensis]|uniref:apolipoprotein N-acyltransferase n=1 Tax=Jannaschia seosinensis TaxID=313367 RepID=UPI000A4919D4|nr:apolipoprotein N-acyltransferase [Jannaschia seosinensis]
MRHLRLLIPVLAGLAAALGQAPWGLWWLALPAFAVGVRACAQARFPALAGLAFGVGYFGLALVWITEPFLVDPEVTAWLAPVALIGICLGFGLLWALAVSLGARYLGGALGVAVAIAGVELTRSYILTGFPWALPGHVLIASPALPSASVLGAHGLGLAVLVGAGLVAMLRPVPVAAGIVLWAAPLVMGAALSPAPEGGGPVIRLVQPNAPQHLKWDPDWIGTFWRRGIEETAAADTIGPPAMTLWPETALPALLRRSQDIRPILAAASGGQPVMIGAQRIDDTGAPRNTLVLLTGPEGEIAARYDKHRLVPFGEFLPFPDLFAAMGFGPLAAQLAGTYRAGVGPVLINVPGVGRVLPMICYEAIFPQDVRAVSRDAPHPRAIFHLTNDAWFGTRIGPWQHLALARLRAAESGLPVMRAANTGMSAVIDARGKVLARLPLGEAGHLDAALPPALPPTPYLATGDWPALAVIGLLAALLGVRKRLKRPATRRSENYGVPTAS